MVENPHAAADSETGPGGNPGAKPGRWRRNIFILGWLCVLLLVMWVWSGEAAQLQSRIFKTYLLGFAGAAGSLFWVMILSGWPWKKRLKVGGGAVAVGVATGSLVRVDGVNGDLVPIAFSFRWQAVPDARLESFVDSEKPSGAPSSLGGLADWPQFLGPDRRPVRKDLKISADWLARPPKEIWRIPIGAGWSGFAVRGGWAVTQEQRGEEEWVSAYDAATGKLLWVHRDAARYDSAIGGVGPRATPTLDERGRVYSLGATGILNAMELKTGRLIWSHNITEIAKCEVPDWGYAGSPLLMSGEVVVSAGGESDRSLLAFDRETGELRWSAGSSPAGYSSPFLGQIRGVPQILILNLSNVSAHDPETGHVLWQYPWPGHEPKVAQPLVLAGDRVLISSGYGMGAAMLQIEREGQDIWKVREIWKNLSIKAKFANMVSRGEHIYALDDGILTCVRILDGERMWKNGRYRHGQMILTAGHLLVQSEDGELVLVEARPDRFAELARHRVFAEKTWNSPAPAGRYLFLRNDHEAVCLEISPREDVE